MRHYLLKSLLILSLFFALAACAQKEDDPLVIADDTEREDVVNEAEVLNDMMDRLKNYYFPTEMGRPLGLSLSYKVKD